MDDNLCIDGSYPTIKKSLRVTITLSKEVEVIISNFKLCVDNTEDGDFPYLDFGDTDFRDAVLEQIDVPMPDGWQVEDFEVEKL